MPNDTSPQRKETPKAAEAFRQYAAMGPARSLRKLAATLAEQKLYKNEATAFAVIGRWSGEHRWQDRIASIASAEADRMLEEAVRLDADTFLATSRLINERITYTDAGHIDAVIKMRESVRKPAQKGSVEVTGKGGGPIQHDHIHRDMSAFTDDEIDSLAAIAERRQAGDT